MPPKVATATGKKEEIAAIAIFGPASMPKARISTGRKMIFGAGARARIHGSSIAARKRDAPSDTPQATPKLAPIATPAAASYAVRPRCG